GLFLRVLRVLCGESAPLQKTEARSPGSRTWLVLLLALIAGCTTDRNSQAPSRAAGAAKSGEPEWFVERAQETGIDFVHFNGMSGEFYFPENMAPGVALLDYDNDGDL